MLIRRESKELNLFHLTNKLAQYFNWPKYIQIYFGNLYYFVSQRYETIQIEQGEIVHCRPLFYSIICQLCSIILQQIWAKGNGTASVVTFFWMLLSVYNVFTVLHVQLHLLSFDNVYISYVPVMTVQVLNINSANFVINTQRRFCLCEVKICTIAFHCYLFLWHLAHLASPYNTCLNNLRYDNKRIYQLFYLR